LLDLEGHRFNKYSLRKNNYCYN